MTLRQYFHSWGGAQFHKAASTVDSKSECLREEASQEVNHAKVDATINTGGIMKQLGCDGLKKRSLHVKTVPPHAEQSLHTPRRYLRIWNRVSARRESTSAYVHMQSWPSACGNGCRTIKKLHFSVPY